MVLAGVIAGGLGVVASTSATASADGEGDRLVKAAMVCEQNAATPGKQVAIGIHLVIEPKWHVYWRNNGDTGLPVSVKFGETPGVSFGALEWPAPHRHVAEGELLDYVHEGEITLIVPVMIGADVTAGSVLDLRATVDWLVCKDACLPGTAEVSMRLPVAATGSRSSDAPKFDAARKTHPRAPKAGEATMTWEGATLTVRVPGATRLAFFPYESDEGVYPLDMIAKGEVAGEAIAVTYAEDVAKVNRVRGMIEVSRGEKKEYLLVDTERPGSR